MIGIIAAFWLAVHIFGLSTAQLHQPATAAFLSIFLLAVPVFVFAVGVLGYGLLVLVLRVLHKDDWLDVLDEAGTNRVGWADVPFQWVRLQIERLTPR
jgi:hypothetical protein